MILTRCPLLCNYIARELQKTELKYCNLLCKTAKKKKLLCKTVFFHLCKTKCLFLVIHVRQSFFFVLNNFVLFKLNFNKIVETTCNTKVI